ncbi:MAG TPA: type II secretion system protein [Candidatus Saccharimonadales bacterium]
MLQKVKQQKQEGFTIIEVLIVLAIAGLIMLVVFMAVPALQRNSRNTQRKNDVSSLLGAVNEFTSNSNGSMPVAADLGTVMGLGKTGFYSGTGTGAGQITLLTGAQAALPSTAAGDRLVIVTGAKCGTSGATVAGAARSVAIQYVIEGSSSFQPTCQES